MKKQIIILILGFICWSLAAYPQGKNDRKVGGIRAGFQSSSMVEQGSKPDTTKNKNSFYVGFFHDQKVISFLSFGSGIEYFQNGFKYPEDSKRVLHTLSIPLYLKFKIGPVFALGGIAGNFKVAERIISGDEKQKPDSNDKSNWFDAAAFVGAGVKISIVIIEARYHWGLIESYDGLYNRYFQIGGGITF